MIVGIGTDMAEIERVKRACESENFLKKNYTSKEIESFRSYPAGLAGNFAVKEAVAKCFGTGFRGFGPRDIEVLRDELGKPFVNLYGRAKELAKELEIDRVHVSITNVSVYAQAFAVCEKSELMQGSGMED